MLSYSKQYRKEVRRLHSSLIALRNRFSEGDYPNVAMIRASDLYNQLKNELPSIREALEEVIDILPLTSKRRNRIMGHDYED